MNIDEYKSDLSKMNSYYSKIDELNLDDDNIFESLNKMFSLEQELYKLDKYTLLLEFLNDSKENQKLMDDYWQIHLYFDKHKNEVTNHLTNKYSKEQLLKICPSNYKLFINNAYINKDHEVKNILEYNKLSLKANEIRNMLINNGDNLSDNDYLKNVLEYIKSTENMAQLENYKSVFNKKCEELGLNEKLFNSLIDNEYDYKEMNVEDYNLPLEQAKEYILQAAEEFYDNDYANRIKKLMINDVDYKNVDNGAWTLSAHNLTPKIGLNYKDGLLDSSILFHELGHAVHLEMINQNDDVNYDYNSIMGETAAVLNEVVLLNYYIDNNMFADLAYKQLYNLYSFSCYDCISSVRFEKHLRDNVDKININDIKNINNYRFYFRRSLEDYYDVNYALGVLNASEIYSEIKNKKLKAKDYYKVLSLGNYYSYAEMLSTIGIDINDNNKFNEEVNNVNNNFEECKDKCHQTKQM